MRRARRQSWSMHTLSLIDAAADLLLGAACAGCRRPGPRLCVTCRAALDSAAFLVEERTSLRVAAANPYRPLLAHMIPSYKDDGALHLARFLGHRLAVAVRALEPPPETVLVPVPSLPAAVRRRGFDHTRALARGAARELRLSHANRLTRRRGGGDQARLGKRARRTNLAGAMRARRSAGEVVIVVDDLITTGATLTEAVRALEQGGALVWGAAVVGDVDDRGAFALV